MDRDWSSDVCSSDLLWKNGLDSDAFQQQLVTHQLSIQAKLEQQGFESIG